MIIGLMNRDKRSGLHRNRNKLINAKVALKKAGFGENGITKKSRAVLSSAARYRGTYAQEARA